MIVWLIDWGVCQAVNQPTPETLGRYPNMKSLRYVQVRGCVHVVVVVVVVI